MIEQQKQCLLVTVSDQKDIGCCRQYSNRIIISRSVTFYENESNDGMKVVQDMTNPNNTEQETQPTIVEDSELAIQVSTENVDNQVIGDGNCNDDMNVPLRRSTRNNKGIPPVKLSLMVKNELKKEPSSWNEMKLLPEEEQKQWIRAAEEEMGSHNQNQTWILCDLHAGKKAIDCKWVFKLKQNADGNVYRHKAMRRKFAPLK